MNTTYGSQRDEIIWYSDNWKWEIDRRTIFHRSGEIKSVSYSIYDQSSGIMWPINHDTADNPFYPKYVRRAIAQHVPKQ